MYSNKISLTLNLVLAIYYLPKFLETTLSSHLCLALPSVLQDLL